MPRDRRPEADPHPVDHSLPLLDFIPCASEGLVSPYWMRPFAEPLDTFPHSGRRLVTDAPRRHTKSTTVHHAIVKWLLTEPKLTIIYYTYGLAFSYENSNAIKRIYQRCGGRMGDVDRQDRWTTREGGGLFATSRDGSLTGRGGDIGVVDDPVKNRAEAESAETRDMIDLAIRNDLIPCLKKDSPILCVASRYHEDDPSGRMLKRGYEHIHLKAITDHPDGTRSALWPEERPLEYLDALRADIGEYAFASNYQGEPQPPTSSLFHGVHTYDADDRLPARVIIGVDLAFSSRKASDYTALVVLGDYVDHYRVLDIQRGQWGLARVRAELAMLRARYVEHHVRMVAYVSGPEIGVFDQLMEYGLHVERLPARFNKQVRAQRTSQAWMQGRVRLPKEAKWLDPLISEVRYFTGVDDAHDDQVDALVAAFDASEGAKTDWAPGHTFAFGTWCV